MKLKKLLPIMTMLLVVLLAGCKKDGDPGVRPTVMSTSPVTNAVNSSVSGKITATFSAPMDASTVTSVQFGIKQGTTVVAGNVTIASTVATFTPSANLSPNTIYTGTITNGVKNTSGLSMAADYVWTFTSGALPDATPPTVTVTSPLNNATGVAMLAPFVVTFSEAMDASSINSTTFSLKQGSTVVVGSIVYLDSKATFTPTNSLFGNTVYVATVTTGAKDVAGNSLANTNTFTFTTEGIPTIASTDPLNNAVGILRSKVIGVTFSKLMNPTTISNSTFTLKQGTTPVVGTVAYTGTTATFDPTGVLAASTVYTATITTGAKDLAGNALAANTVWTFTTSASSSLSAVNLGSSINYVILAKTGISNVSTSAITGDLGLSPAATSYITGLSLTNAIGYAISAQVTGNIYAADMASPTPVNLTDAVNDMITAYNDAAGRPTPDFLELGGGNIGGRTLTPGLYKWTNTVTMPASITISGNATDVWIFQVAGNLLMSSAVNVTLIGGALPQNIYWQVAGQATFGTTSHFEGILMSMTGITLQTGASMKGRALAQTAVVLDGNTVVKAN